MKSNLFKIGFIVMCLILSGHLLFSQTVDVDVYFRFEIYDPETPPSQTYVAAYTLQTTSWESSPVNITGYVYQGTSIYYSDTFYDAPYPDPLPRNFYRIKVYVQRTSDQQNRTGVSDWSDYEELDDPASPDPIKVEEFN